ncbi:MAG TPA: hypothetical protein VGN04_06545 [Herbaspirillum sp.]|jgi:hypothetical protein
MKSLFGKLLASTLFAGMLAMSAPASAAAIDGLPVNILCQTLQNGVDSLLALDQTSLLAQARGLVDQMIGLGCPANMIPSLPLPLP